MMVSLSKFFESFGRSILIVKDIAKNTVYGRFDIREIIKYIESYGIKSSFIIFLIASAIGMVVSLQFGKEVISNFGTTDLIGGFVAITLLRELCPVFVAIVLSGTVGASMTAELGTMKVTDQIDAMEIFHMCPVRFLLVPRFLSVLIIGPILTILGAYFSLFSAQISADFILDISSGSFWNSVKDMVDNQDLLLLLVKSMVFSFLIVSIAAINGMSTGSGSDAVGEQTTKTVKYCLVAIILTNYVITLGI